MAARAPTPAPKPAPVARTAPKPRPAPAIARTEPSAASPQRAAGSAKGARRSGVGVEVFTEKEVTDRIYAQPGEALEVVPGLIVAQHSGSGKANQYFLRGFALDHGNDIALSLDGMPINMPSFVHGQGYADANFVIPEMLSVVDARKGPYFADEGAFASAGAVHMQYLDRLEDGLFVATGGSFLYGRLLGAKSVALAGGNLLAALELGNYAGPWEHSDDAHKINGVLRWSRGTQEDGLSITAMAYSNHWNATDQIP